MRITRFSYSSHINWLLFFMERLDKVNNGIAKLKSVGIYNGTLSLLNHVEFRFETSRHLPVMVIIIT